MTVTNYWKNVICRIVIIVGLTLVLTAVFQAQSARADEGPDIKVFLNEKYLEFPHPPVLRENVTLVPFRALFEGMNMTVEWDHPRRTAIGEKEGLTIELPIDEPYAFINGVRTELEQPATLVGDHTMVPLRFVGESTGALVSWHAQTWEIGIFEEEHIASLGMTKEEFEAALNKAMEDLDLPEPPVDEGPVEEPNENDENTELEYADQVDLSLLTGMYSNFRIDITGYECGGICWDFYTFLDDARIVVGIPEGGGPETIDCSVDTCHSYTIDGDELILDNRERLSLRMTTDGELEINNYLVFKVEPVQSGLKLNDWYSYTGYSGLIGITGGASYWVVSMEFNSDGTFTSDSLTAGSFESGLGTTHASSSDGDYGTYSISGNTITLTFSDGTVVNQLFFLHHGDIEDIQIGENNFYTEDPNDY